MNNKINHPSHYNFGNIETIEIINDQGWIEGFCLGNAIKYITRAGKKDPSTKIEDLEKAIWYLSYYIEIFKEINLISNEDKIS